MLSNNRKRSRKKENTLSTKKATKKKKRKTFFLFFFYKFSPQIHWWLLFSNESNNIGRRILGFCQDSYHNYNIIISFSLWIISTVATLFSPQNYVTYIHIYCFDILFIQEKLESMSIWTCTKFLLKNISWQDQKKMIMCSCTKNSADSKRPS